MATATASQALPPFINVHNLILTTESGYPLLFEDGQVWCTEEDYPGALALVRADVRVNSSEISGAALTAALLAYGAVLDAVASGGSTSARRVWEPTDALPDIWTQVPSEADVWSAVETEPEIWTEINPN